MQSQSIIKSIGIDFGDEKSIVFAPLQVFYPPDSLKEDTQTFISCIVNKTASNESPSQLLLCEGAWKIVDSSQDEYIVSHLKRRLIETPQTTFPVYDDDSQKLITPLDLCSLFSMFYYCSCSFLSSRIFSGIASNARQAQRYSKYFGSSSHVSFNSLSFFILAIFHFFKHSTSFSC